MPSGNAEQLAAIMMGAALASFVIVAVIYAWTSWALSMLFTKFGVEAWKGWVPVLNLIVLFRLGGQNPLWLLAFLVPGVSIVGTVFLVLAAHRVNVRCGRGVGMTVLAALLFPVWATVLGFGSARPNEPRPVQHAPLAPPQQQPEQQPVPVAQEPAHPSPAVDESTVTTSALAPQAPVSAPAVDEATVVVPRRTKSWKLETAQGQKVELTASTVIVGRDPAAPEGAVGAQLVPLLDADRSVSKTHARLDLVDGAWLVTDLHSTNGVKLSASQDFVEGDKLEAGVAAHAEAHLSFGDLSARIRLSS